MLYKSRGIALSYIKFRESSIITRIFTETFGIQSYIVNSVRTKSAKTKIALFQPLTLLDLVVYHSKKNEINRISEIKCSYTFQSIPYDIRKTSIALFITELLNQTLREEGENTQLFDFIQESIIAFDMMKEGSENFHLQFLMHLSKYHGIKPDSAMSLLKEIGHAKAYDKLFCEQVDFFLHSSFDQQMKISKTARSEILTAMINYYRYHYDAVREFKSIQVLKEVLGG